MYDPISGSMQADALHTYFALAFAMLLFLSHVAQSEESFPAPNSDLSTIRFAASNINLQPMPGFNAGITPLRSKNVFFDKSRLNNTSLLHLITETKQQNNWSAEATWKLVPAKGSLIPQLRYESEEALFVIKPSHHSLAVLWQKPF